MLKRLTQATLLVTALVIGLAYAPAGLTPQACAQSAEQHDVETFDELLLSNGQIVRGKILNETATEIEFEIRKPGFPPVRVTYAKSEVQSIQRNVEAETAGADMSDDDSKSDKDDDATEIDPDAAKLYYFSMSGRFGRDVSQTPLANIIEDINKTFDDAVPNPEQGGPPTIVDPETRDKHIVVIHLRSSGNEQAGFQDIFRAEDIIPLLEHEIHERHRRVVFLVEQAVNGAAFLPWLSPEMYFTPDAEMYFTQDFDLWDTGDEMVDEKLIGAHIGTASGFAILGGYEEIGPKIIKAMARSQYWLKVLWTGETPRLSLRPPAPNDAAEGWEILSDDGRDENQDTLQQDVRDPNDLLHITAERAFRLGMSKGTVKDRDDLLFYLGIHRNYVWVDNASDEIQQAWQDDLNRFFKYAFPGNQRQRPGELWLDYQDAQQDLGQARNFNERRKARGRMMRILKQIRSIIQRVAEVVDPNGQFTLQVEQNLYELETDQQLDSENR